MSEEQQVADALEYKYSRQNSKDESEVLQGRVTARVVKLSKYELLAQKVGRVLSFTRVTVPDYHHAIVMEFKRFARALPPGQHNVNTYTEDVTIVKDLFIEEDYFGIKTINKQFVCILPPGQYFLNSALNEEVEVHAMTVVPENNMGVLTSYGRFRAVLPPGKVIVNSFLSERLDVVKLSIIPDNNRGVVTVYGKFHRVVMPGETFINELLGEKLQIVPETIIEDDEYGLFVVDGHFERVLESGRGFANPVLNEKIVKRKRIVIAEGHVGILLVQGVFKEQLPPGVYQENPYLFEKIVLVNMQLLTKELKPVEITTKDTVTIPAVYSILVYKIVDARKAICDVEDVDFSIRETIKTIMHQVLSENSLDKIMCDKVQLSEQIKERVARNSANWGIQIERIDIKDMKFSAEFQEAMSASARAQRAADSKLITAKAEVEAAVLFRQAADQLDSPAAQQMREWESLIQICKHSNTRVLFMPDIHHRPGSHTNLGTAAATGNSSSAGGSTLMDRVLAEEIKEQSR